MFDLRRLLSRWREPSILVLGDAMLDRYCWGEVDRISPEAPVPVLRADLEEIRPGGAAAVAALLAGLKAKVQLAGVVGCDNAGRSLRRLLDEANVGTEFLLEDETRITTEKTRVLGRAAGRHVQQLVRIDREECTPLSEALQRRLFDSLRGIVSGYDMVLISDYAKGCCVPGSLAKCIEHCASLNIPVAVDPAQILDYERYRGCDLVVPNRCEAEKVLGTFIRTSADALLAADTLSKRFGFEKVVIKLDRDGIAVMDRSADERMNVASRTREVYDVTGAGDTVLATLGIGIASGLSVVEAAHLANVSAGLQVERHGVAILSREEIQREIIRSECPVFDKVVDLAQLIQTVASARRLGQRIVFTNGCFDLLHIGHVRYLREAAILGDLLIVAVNGDASVRRLKGPTRPVIDEQSRVELLAELPFIDHVILFDDPTPHRLLEALQPDVLVKGGDYTPDGVVGREVVASYGGTIRVMSFVQDVTTTRIIERIGHSVDASTADR